MSPVQIGAATMLMLAAAGWAAVHGLRRVPSSVAAARRAMRDSASGRGRASPTWTGEWLPSRIDAGLGEDLSVVGVTAVDVATRMVTAVVVMAAFVGPGVAALVGAGLLPVVSIAVVPLTAAMAGWTVLRGVVARARARRTELRRAANDFVQLVAIGLTTDQSVEEAIRFALEVGDGDGLDDLRQEIVAAPMRGVSVWEAIDEVGSRFGVPELSEFATSVERQGMQGVAIGDTVATIAAGMRAKALDQLERDAEQANANLAGPTVGFVVATVVFLAYPLAQRISDAFGG